MLPFKYEIFPKIHSGFIPWDTSLSKEEDFLRRVKCFTESHYWGNLTAVEIYTEVIPKGLPRFRGWKLQARKSLPLNT